jgi:hypothetical protein
MSHVHKRRKDEIEENTSKRKAVRNHPSHTLHHGQLSIQERICVSKSSYCILHSREADSALNSSCRYESFRLSSPSASLALSATETVSDEITYVR